MREIKFRAWDTVLRKYTYATLGDLVCGVCMETGVKRLSIYRQVWEQFTGLKDKNGKDIYENDIVRVKHREWIDYEIYQVRYYAPGFDFFPELDSEINGLSLAESEYYTFEVIGNIHENPELLEEKK